MKVSNYFGVEVGYRNTNFKVDSKTTGTWSDGDTYEDTSKGDTNLGSLQLNLNLTI
jgi:hypothetical protein